MRKVEFQVRLRCKQQVSATKDDVQASNRFSAWEPRMTKEECGRCPAVDPSPAGSRYLLLAAQAVLLAIALLREDLLSLQSP